MSGNKSVRGGWQVKRVSYSDTKPFLLNIHYARRMPVVQYAFGLFESDELVGVCTYGQPASPSLARGIAGEGNKKNVLELNRLCFKPEFNGNNRASYLVSHSLKMLPNRTFVVSYADTGWNHVGYVYQATNFYFSTTTKARTDKYSEGHSRHYSKDETRRVPRTSKHRYIYLVGTKRDVRDMKRELRYPITKNYPKGESQRYDTANPIQTGEGITNDQERSKTDIKR